MGLAFSGEVTNWPCGCDPGQGTNPAGSGVQYVISLNGLQGLVTLAAGGGVAISSTGNSILIAADGSAGLGTVTTVNATSSNTNLVVTGGPVTTVGTFAFSLAGALNSISGLATAADKMIYTTALDTYAVTDLPAFGRTLVANASAADARTDLGLVIGTDVQAFSQDLTDFVTNASWAGANLTLAGNLNAVQGNFSGNGGFGGTFGVVGTSTFVGAMSAGGISAGTFAGDGAAITGLSAANISAGTLAVARGGTSFSSYTTGDSIYASGAGTLAKLAAGAAGTFYRFAGAGVAPVVSTLILPNAATVGDLFSSSTTNTMSRITAVATGNALISGGVATLPSWGKITSSHVDSTIATLTGGSNSNINAMTGLSSLTGDLTLSGEFSPLNAINDSSASPGTSGYVFTSTGSGTSWTNQIFLDTLRIDGLLSSEATVTAAGVTGAQTINKMTGTVRFAAAASTLIITNSLALAASTRALATVCTNDTTLKSVCAVVTNGFITLTANAAATAETEVFWELRGLT